MNIQIFARQLEAINGRLTELYRGANHSSSPPIELLPVAFKELGTFSEELQVAVEELCQQNEELISARMEVEVERRRYQDLFEFAPDAYLVTDAQGTIQEANRAAAQLLNISQQYLIGKPIVVFIASEQRWQFRSELNQQYLGERSQHWELRLQPRHSEPFDAAVTIASVSDAEGKPITFRWLLRDISTGRRLVASEDKQALSSSDQESGNLSFGRAVHIYSKKEIIPLNRQAIWQVQKGLVKLSTLSDTGEETLVGFAGPYMPFGSGLTALQAYQATVLSQQVELVEISLTELAASPHLAQALLPHINRRLKQTELLVAISGKRRVQERLYQLLQLLKQEIGQPVEQGTCLNVRLTHEDLASACCTTRVTMTRVLRELQLQGKIVLDSKRHMILSREAFG